MDTLKAIQKRRAVHKFRTRPIPDKMLFEILEAARWAPSAGNLQSVRIIVVEDEELKKELADAALDQTWMVDAPVILVICSLADELEKWYGKRGKALYSIQDAAVAAQNIMIAATSLGVGSCFVSAFADAKVRRVLELPDFLYPYVIIPLGYAAEKPKTPSRYRLWDILFWNKFKNKERKPGIFPLQETLTKAKENLKKKLIKKKK